MNNELRFIPILDHISPEALGFAIEVDNCQKSFELLSKENYVSFGGYRSHETHFIPASGYHIFTTKGKYSLGFRSRDGFDQTNYPIFTLTEFLDICNSPEGQFSQEISLTDILQEAK